MTRIDGITNWFDDRMNPIVVKELRQGMQSRSFIVIVNLLLAALTVICLLSVMSDPDVATRATGGRFIYLFLQGALFFSCIVFVPMYTLVRLRSERGENNVDLFFTTTLQATKIVRGKFFAGISLVSMLYSVCVPFMLFTYMLRGYDIPTMLLSLGIGYLVTALTLASCIVIGCWSPPKALGQLVVLATAIGLVILACFVIGPMSEILAFGVQDIFRDRDRLAVLAAVLISAFFIFKLLEAMAIGLVSPPRSNRTLRLRVWASLTIVTMFFVFTGAAWFSSGFAMMPFSYGMQLATAYWMSIALGLVVLLLLIAVCEPDGFSARILDGRPRGSLAVIRPVAFLYTHGASGGILWALVHAAGIIGTFYAVLALAPAYSASGPYSVGYMMHEVFDDFVQWLLLAYLFQMNYILLGKIIMRAFFPPSAAKHTWVAVLFALFAILMTTLIITFALDPRHWDRSFLWNLVTPFADVESWGDIVVRFYFAGLWGAVSLLICFPRGLRDFAEYQTGKPSKEPEPVTEQSVPAIAVLEGAE